MAFVNRGADVPMDNLDVAFHPRRTGSREEETETEDREDKALENGKTKKSTSKLAGMLDANVYATKKTIAQGMLDVALLTANASQLKYLLQVGTQHEFYYLMMSLICISIILQLVIGVAMFFTASYDLNEAVQAPKADRLNDWTTVGVFLIVAINVFISAFGMAEWPDFPTQDKEGVDKGIRGFNNTDFNFTSTVSSVG